MSTSTEGSVVVDTPAGIAFAGLLSLRGRLRIELNTGMRHSGGSTLKAYNNAMGTNFKTKKKALKDCNARIEEAQHEAKVRANAAQVRGKLEKMTLPQIKEVCKQAGLTGYSRMKKSELIDELHARAEAEIDESLKRTGSPA